MSVFAQSLKTLKTRTTQLGTQLSKGSQLFQDFREDKDGKVDDLDTLDFADGATSEDHYSPVNGPVIVRYSVQNAENDGDRESVAFMLDGLLSRQLTAGMVRSRFELPGRYHLRFRTATPEQAFGGFMWVDLLDDDPVPIYQGNVIMKALKLPGGTDSSSVEAFVAPAAPYAAAPPPTGQPTVPAGATAAPVAAPSRVPPRTPENLMFADDDIIGGVPSSKPRAVTAPTPKVAMPNRDECAFQREKEVQDRVNAAAATVAAQVAKDEATRSGKIDAGSKLGPEMDKWAKTPDGQSFKDIRGLLCSVHEVMWSDSEWQPVPLSGLLAPGAIKKAYRKAIILTHPDRHQNANYEQQFRADRIFNALNEAFKVSGD